MSSKRGLYKPAKGKEIDQRDRRKPLAQGRLITSGAFNTNKLPAQPGLIQGNLVSHPAGGDTSNTVSLSQSARKDLSALLKTDVSFQTENSVNPRRMTPQAAATKSPGDTRPSESLDLSDTDSDILFNRRDVLVIDASQRMHEADDTGIDVQVQYEHSPAKVICHSPSKLYGNIRNTGDVSLARQVTMDTVPRVSILGTSQHYSDEASGNHSDITAGSHADVSASNHGDVESSCQSGEGDEPREKLTATLTHKQPLVVRETAIAGGPVDDHSSSTPVATIMPSHDAGDLTEGDTSGHQTSQDSIDKPRREPPRSRSAALSTSNTKTRKKATRVVQSRYMQSAPPAKKGPMKAIDRSIITKSSSSFVPSKKPPSGVRKASTSFKKSTPSPHPAQSTFSVTPEVKGHGGKVSTPTLDGSLFMAPGGIDVSAIGPSGANRHYQGLDMTPGLSNESHVHTSHRSSNLHNQRSLSASPRHPDRDSITQTSHSELIGKKKLTSHISQKRLDLSYHRYIQWLYLESKSRKVFHDQEKHVMGQLNAIHEENEKLLEENHELDLQLSRARHLNSLDDTLDMQLTGLTPVVSSLSKVRPQYSKLSQALDTTRHQIPARGVLIPSDAQQFDDCLLRVLGESEQLLGEINSLVHQGEPKTSTFAQTIRAMEDSLGSELQEMAKCGELLAAMKTLTTQENSLLIQGIEECED